MKNWFAGILPSLALSLILGGSACAQGQLRFCLRSEPKTFDPLKVEDDSSVAIRYLTGGVLVRMNRQTQALEPELAQSWKVSKDGKQISFKLRSGISFSDGTPFSAEDVAYTVQQLMDPSLHSPTGDAFRSGPGNVDTKILSPTQITITFPAPVAGLDRQFDQVAIMSAHSSKKEMAVLGPFMVADYKARIDSALAAQSELLEDRRARPQAALPRFDQARYSARIATSRCFASSVAKSI